MSAVSAGCHIAEGSTTTGCADDAANRISMALTDNDKAQAVEDALAGGPLCPFCQSDNVHGFEYEQAFAHTQKMLLCQACGRTFTQRPAGDAWRVGKYWTNVWEWVYEVGRPADAKPIRTRKPTPDWTAGVNTNKPKRSNARSAGRKRAKTAK